MAPSPRLSDKELAAINAAAVTREYTVKPHLGTRVVQMERISVNLYLFRLQDCVCGQWVC